MAIVKFKKSSVTGRAPQTTDLEYGEPALNYTDGRLYFKNSSNTVEYFKKAQPVRLTTTTTSGSINLDFGVYDDFVITLGANTTFSISNLSNKIGCTGTIVIKQDSIGGRTFTKASEMKTPLGGATIEQVTLPNSLSILSYYVVDTSTVLINYIGNFS